MSISALLLLLPPLLLASRALTGASSPPSIFPLDDVNALSVLTYGVEPKPLEPRALGATHVIIVGHTNCGGVAAAHAAAENPGTLERLAPPLRRWLAPLVEVAKGFEGDVAALMEENVSVQVGNVVRSDAVRDAWAQGHDVQVHGWVYELETGRLRDLGVSVRKDGSLEGSHGMTR